MQEYIQGALQQKFIVASTSFASASFYFVEENLTVYITVHYSYPRTLVPLALEQLRTPMVFTKL